MDEEGYFYIVDRKKDLIIVGGYNVYPREIDEVLHTHPKIREAVTVGVNHRSRGETVKAYIVPEEGANLTVPEVVAFCRQKLASFKVPRLIEFREELPKTMVGKVLRRILREEERMRLLLQRVREGKVTIEGQNVASIGKGLVVLVGFGPEDTIDLRGGKLWNTLIEKMVGLRIFPDDEGKMNRGIEEAGGEIILVSQFTLYADSRKGRRPSFHLSAPPGVAEPLFQHFVEDVRSRLPGRVQQGVFAADMDVSLTNWGPVTLLLDSADF